MTAIEVCLSSDLLEAGKGVRFSVTAGSDDAVGFVIRYKGTVYGYLNRCAHVPVELDWNPGEFIESSGLYIMCATHGAIYQPESGYCSGGPCRGGRLRKIEVSESDGHVFWHPDDYIQPVIA